MSLAFCHWFPIPESKWGERWTGPFPGTCDALKQFDWIAEMSSCPHLSTQSVAVQE